MTVVDGKKLIAWGHKPGVKFAGMLRAAKEARDEGVSIEDVRKMLENFVPPPPPATLPLRAMGLMPFHFNMDTAQTPGEIDNQLAVVGHMDVLMRTPTIVAGAVMPDACPVNEVKGTIPVGGVIAAKNAIHPGMHSADICCSMAYTNLGRVDPKLVLDAAQTITHFGPGGRSEPWQMPPLIAGAFKSNLLLAPIKSLAEADFGTQGDGNHFFYVGLHGEDTVIVTHHGSRRPGAKLYKTGMGIADMFRKELSPETPPHNAWIPADTEEGRVYWEAMQIIRLWTKHSHFEIHDRVVDAVGAGCINRFWNEHNFVFQREDGLYYHAKGATPAYKGFSADDSGLTLIPLNMAEPILIARGLDAPHGLGFAPHGAGRHMGRGAYKRSFGDQSVEEIVREQTKGIDARFFNNVPDVSELPGAYKKASMVRAQIEAFGLADIVDEIKPYGCIMAGEFSREWRK